MISARTLAAEAQRVQAVLEQKIAEGDLPEGFGNALCQFCKDSYHFATACVSNETAAQSVIKEVHGVLNRICGSTDFDYLNRVITDRDLLDRMCETQMALSSGTIVL